MPLKARIKPSLVGGAVEKWLIQVGAQIVPARWLDQLELWSALAAAAPPYPHSGEALHSACIPSHSVTAPSKRQPCPRGVF